MPKARSPGSCIRVASKTIAVVVASEKVSGHLSAKAEQYFGRTPHMNTESKILSIASLSGKA